MDPLGIKGAIPELDLALQGLEHALANSLHEVLDRLSGTTIEVKITISIQPRGSASSNIHA